MITETQELKASTREGYQILLRAEARLLLPVGKPKICDFYQRLARTCVSWAEEIHGERLRREFCALETVREKSRFRTQYYRFCMYSPWEEGRYAVILCESELTGQWEEIHNSYHRISHVWDVEEELLLPPSQILSAFGVNLSRDMLPFRPDGIYPTEDGIVLFRNPTPSSVFIEKKLPRAKA